MIVEKNIGAMVEVNCETDFVARNKTFQQFVELASIACIQHVNNMPTNDVLSKVYLVISSILPAFSKYIYASRLTLKRKI